MKALPSNQRLWSEFKDRGLSFFLVEVQENTFDVISDLAKEHNVDMPMPLRFEGDFTNYVKLEDGTTLPYAYVISPEGKVVWQGKSGYEAVVRKQLARIKFKALRRLEVDSAVVSAAQMFEAGQYSKAHKAAGKIMAKQEEGSAAWSDAKYVADHVNDKVAAIQKTVDTAIEAKRYHEAVAALEQLSGKAFKGLELADAAAKQLKSLKKDKQVKKELKAWAAFDKLQEANKKVDSDLERVESLAGFIRKNAETAAAAEARQIVLELAGEDEE